MILRRLTEHVKAQNWFAVAIDFVIVVVGVFMGVQVQQWSGDISERRSERLYLERILADIDLSIETTEITRSRLIGYSDGHRLIVASLRACALPDDKKDAFADGVSDIGKVGPSSFVLGTMEEMLSAGKFSIIRNAAVRDALNGLARDAQYQRDIFAAIIEIMASLRATTDTRVIRINTDYRSPWDPVAWSEVDIDFEALCKDRQYQAAVSNVRALTDNMRNLNDRALTSLEAARSVLAAELGAPPPNASSGAVR